MRVYINSNGEQFNSKPKLLITDKYQFIPPTEQQLIDAGWQIREVIDTEPETYEEKVVNLIRERYTIDDELALHRQRDTKPEEFQEYYNYCEKCKQKAKEE